jgi:hypothetical protein
MKNVVEPPLVDAPHHEEVSTWGATYLSKEKRN